METNTVSNTAFRGFGAPQGLIAAELIVEEIAYALDTDPLEVRKANYYGPEVRTLTPYHQHVTDSILARLTEDLEQRSEYQARREAVLA
jgi:xanthine dehydrogenase large subunit